MVIVLVDSRSTYNFLGSTIAKRSSCDLASIIGLQVTVVNEDILMAQKTCKQLRWEV